MDFNAVIKAVLENDSPDLHLQVGHPPVIRSKTGEVVEVPNMEPLKKAEVEEVIAQMLTDEQKKRFEQEHELDFSHSFDGTRFRINVFQEQNGPAVAFRTISSKVPSIDDLGAPEVLKQIANLSHGLVLVTGSTGMGKSTTLAAMLEHINQTKSAHIITIEDPIEYVFENEKALITQREVNEHTQNFANAIRSALRQDPDVVMVGEMRDLETIAAAITLAETGHLVLSTLHTQDAAQTVDRMIDVFPAYQQQQIRAQLAGTLKAVISQVLIPRADGQGRVAAWEIMLSNDAIRNCIAKGETHQIYSMIQLNRASGMQLMDESLESLYRNGVISASEAIAKASDVETMQQKLQNG